MSADFLIVAHHMTSFDRPLPVQSPVRTQIGNQVMRIYADLPSAPGKLAFTGLAIRASTKSAHNCMMRFRSSA